MNKIYLSGNYVMIQRDGAVASPFSARETIYRRNSADNGYDIIFKGMNRASILDSEITVDEWENDTAVLWDATTILTFLRENTSNFNTASGGSGATYKAVYDFNFNGVDAMVVTTLENNFPTPPINPVWVFTGYTSLNVNTDYNGLLISTNGIINGATSDAWRFLVGSEAGVGVLKQSYASNGNSFSDANYVKGVDLGFQAPCIVTVEYYEPVG